MLQTLVLKNYVKNEISTILSNSSLSFQRRLFYLLKWKIFENDEKYFLFHVKMLLSFIPYLHFCPEFFSHIGKRFDKTAKVNFKIGDVTDWQT